MPVITRLDLALLPSLKKMHWILHRDVSGDVPYPECRLVNSRAVLNFHYWGGVSLASQYPNLEFEVSDSTDAPRGLVDFMGSIHIDIVSHKLAAALQLVGAEIELFPVAMSYNGRRLDGQQFFALNSLMRPRALDLKRSDVDLDEELGDVLVARKVVLDETAIANLNWLVVDELNRLAVSSKVIDAIRLSGCTGCAFSEPGLTRF